MTTSSTVVDVSSFTTDAKFRTWGSAVSAAIVASGVTVTGDTGQANWTTATRPTTASVKQVYEVYRFNDTLQSTKPIFMRIDYGSNNNASGQGPCAWLTVGTGSDGAGAITGVIMAATPGNVQLFTTASTLATTGIAAAYSTTAGACFINTGYGSTGGSSHTGVWCVARTCDSSGVTTNDGLVVYRQPSQTAPTIICYSFATSTIYGSRNVGSASLSTAASISGGTTMQLYRNYAIAPTPFPTLGAVSYYTADITVGSIFAAASFGSSTHNYLAGGANTAGHDTSANSSMIGAYIWE